MPGVMAISTVDLSGIERERLRAAVQAVMEGAAGALSEDAPLSLPLRQGARATLEGADDVTARRFQSMLEIGYLVASADGLADDERHALAALLSHVTGTTVGVDTLELHFQDLEAGCEMLGRRERLRRASEEFDDGISRWEAVRFAALVALADGKLGDEEVGTLATLGQDFGLSEDQIADAVGSMLGRVRSQLGETG